MVVYNILHALYFVSVYSDIIIVFCSQSVDVLSELYAEYFGK